MCRFVASLMVLIWLNVFAAFGAEYRLNNGDVYKGEAASFNDDGLVVRLYRDGEPIGFGDKELGIIRPGDVLLVIEPTEPA